MAKYAKLDGLNELARKASDPEVRKLIEEAFSDDDSSTDQQSAEADEPDSDDVPRPRDTSKDDYWQGLKDEPASFWGDLLRKMFGPAGEGPPESRKT